MSVFPRGFALAYGDGDLVDGFYKENWGQTPGLPLSHIQITTH